MSKLLKNSLTLAVVFSAFFSFSSAHAAPDAIDKFIVESSLFSHNRFGETAEETKKLVENNATTSRIRMTYGINNQVIESSSSLVKTALTYIGVPYKFGGNSKAGLDCSALVQQVFAKAMNLSLPRVAAEQARATKKIAKQDLKPGDLVFFNTRKFVNSHVGIYVGDNQFIHAPRTGAKVRVESMSSYWQKRFTGARRVSVDVVQASAKIN